MKIKQFGFGVIQIVAVVAVMGIVAMVAVPKYNAYVDKAKLTEAFSLAGDSRKKVNEYYVLSGHFPRTDIEANALLPDTLTLPEYVEKIVINHNGGKHAVVVEAYMKDGVITNELGGDQYVFMAADESAQRGARIQWSCGAVGINPDLLPENCR